MRLLDVDTFRLQEFAGSSAAPPYAILSHTWGQDEVSYQDLQDLGVAEGKAGFEKIRFACREAKADGYRYAWVDTCCINKESSHELSEAINSMYSWYMNAAVCYVYLSDVPANCPLLSDHDYLHPVDLRWIEAFEDSRWFTRGWTLQELIAPRIVQFFGSAWNFIGALTDLVQRVSGITNIQADVLQHTRPLNDLSIARRISWAAKRQTTRIEDEAYSLFGILDVNMPLLYGEGPKAFMRLQEAIIHQSTDQSIFAWNAPAGPVAPRELLLAPSARCFVNASNIRRRRATASESAFRISNKGLEITLPIIHRRLSEEPESPYFTLGILDCKYEGSSDILALVMSQHPFNIQGDTAALELYVSGFDSAQDDSPQPVSQYSRLIPISRHDMSDAQSTLLTITRDLQNQNYIRTFNSNEASWFPVRFMGNQANPVPTLRDCWPEDCWYESSRTMRLRAPSNTYGGIVVDVKGNRSVLVVFGVKLSSSNRSKATRYIHKLVFIDPECPPKAHVQCLMQRDAKGSRESIGLKLNRYERLVARLWRGALTVSVENVNDEHVVVPSSPSMGTLSPPMSPLASPRSPRSSFSGVRRKDSMIQDNNSEGSDASHDEIQRDVHETQQCEHCRFVQARAQVERERRRQEQQRKEEEKEAERIKVEKAKKMRTRAKQAGVGLSLGSMLMEIADGAEFL